MTAALPDAARIGVTGARGILGSRLIDACVESGFVPVPYQGDVRDKCGLLEWTMRIDAVLHSAAVVPVSIVETDIAHAVAVNVGGTAAVARAAAERDLPLAYVSTSHVYETSPVPLSEESPVRPVTKYGLTKLQGEVWCDALHPSSLLVRVFSFFDARQPEPYLVPTLRRRVAEAAPNGELRVNSTNSTRDLADAAWMARAIVRLVRVGATGRVNCGTGSGLSVGDVARAVAATQGRTDLRLVDATPEKEDHLVADASLLRRLVPDLPPFDLTRALIDAARA